MSWHRILFSAGKKYEQQQVLYNAAGLQFNFSPDYISELMLFVYDELAKVSRPPESKP